MCQFAPASARVISHVIARSVPMPGYRGRAPLESRAMALVSLASALLAEPASSRMMSQMPYHDAPALSRLSFPRHVGSVPHGPFPALSEPRFQALQELGNLAASEPEVWHAAP